MTHSEKIKEGIANTKKVREQVDELNILLKMFDIKKIALYSTKSTSSRDRRWRNSHRFRLYGDCWEEIEYFQSFLELKQKIHSLISQQNML